MPTQRRDLEALVLSPIKRFRSMPTFRPHHQCDQSRLQHASPMTHPARLHSCLRAISAAVSLVRALLRSTSRPAASDGHVSILARHRPSPARQFLWGRRLAPRSGRPSMRARSRSMRARRSSRARTARAHSYPIGSSSICARCVRFRESQWSLGGKSPAPPTINHVLVTGVSFAVRQGQLCQPNAATWRRSS